MAQVYVLAFREAYKGAMNMLETRLPSHGESVECMKKNVIPIDCTPTKDGGRLLKIFTEAVIAPVFFELIQRKGDEGFGEGDFRALFESMERGAFFGTVPPNKTWCA